MKLLRRLLRRLPERRRVPRERMIEVIASTSPTWYDRASEPERRRYIRDISR